MSKFWSNTKQDGGYFAKRILKNDISYAQIFNESDGGGTLFYNKLYITFEKTIMEYVYKFTLNTKKTKKQSLVLRYMIKVQTMV